MFTVVHYWDVPSVATLPAGASVVVKSRCGAIKDTIPAWKVTEWQRTATDPSEVPTDHLCPGCAS